MRQAYENREETAPLGEALRAALVDKYASVVVTSRLLKLIADAHIDAGKPAVRVYPPWLGRAGVARALRLVLGSDS
jgi:hypothetical protein